MTKSPTRGQNVLMYAAPEANADMAYATRFFTPDPYIFIRTKRGRRIFVLSDLEIDRARATANAHSILPLSRFMDAAAKKRRSPDVADVVDEVLRELAIRSVVVPGNFPLFLADRLRKKRVRVKPVKGMFFPEREQKTPDEIREIRKTMRITEKGVRAGVDLLERSRVKNGWVVYKGKRLTSEMLRREINSVIFADGCVPAHTIVASGKQGCDPHEVGHGPIRANVPIIVDVFPRAEVSGYFGDITRTFVKGKAKDEVKRLYSTVLHAQRMAVRMVKPGVNGRDIHEAITAHFAVRGYETGSVNGRMQGFFHGTGHGIGLEIHEMPRVGPVDYTLRKGMVLTVEPGLYYYPTGGVRIEDTVLVTKDGVQNLTRFPKFLEIP